MQGVPPAEEDQISIFGLQNFGTRRSLQNLLNRFITVFPLCGVSRTLDVFEATSRSWRLNHESDRKGGIVEMPAQLLTGFVIIDVDRRKCVGIGVKGGFKDCLEEFPELRPFTDDSQWRISGNLIVGDAALVANLFCVSYMVSGKIGIRCKEINVVNLITEKSFGPDR